jgi:hypothetical protein
MQIHRTVACALALALFAGCASTRVSNRQSEIEGQKIPRPRTIIVHDIALTPADLPPGSALAPHATAPDKPMDEKQLETGRQLGAAIAKSLVEEINATGMHAVRADGAPGPVLNDIEIYGAFVSVDEGSAAKRVIVGFGYGGANLQTFVEGFQMTDQGLRRLGSGEVGAGGNKTPGVAVPVLVTLATANPIGLVVGGAAKAYGELSGSETIEGDGKRTAKEIAEVLKQRFEEQGWISK